ncbi:hypothetical protein V565_062110 [Rhizoctonia solani 123E]|uniref:Uncharacterized protein n=1 Tax=Rhizoctonia solani 123E TaxID=1423351 RepID=A0A074RWC7_9AGAM|nr:hypothetical protein V565_062110 [Rhizoctonia solani 123E]
MSNATHYNNDQPFNREQPFIFGDWASQDETYGNLNHSPNSPSMMTAGLGNESHNEYPDSTWVDQAPAEPAPPSPPQADQAPHLQAPHHHAPATQAFPPPASTGIASTGPLGYNSGLHPSEFIGQLDAICPIKLAQLVAYWQPPTPISATISPAVLVPATNGYNLGHPPAGPSQLIGYPAQENQWGQGMAGPSIYPTQTNHYDPASLLGQYQSNHYDHTVDQAPYPDQFTLMGPPAVPTFPSQVAGVDAFSQSTYLALDQVNPMPMEPIAPAPAPALTPAAVHVPVPALAPAHVPAPALAPTHAPALPALPALPTLPALPALPAPAQAPQTGGLVLPTLIPRVQSGFKRKHTLKRQVSTASAMSIDGDQGRPTKRRKTRGAPFIPNAEWQQLQQLNLNAPGKYYTHPASYEPNYSGIGDAVKRYACLYIDPFNDTQCWRKKHNAQPEEWLSSLDGRKEKGFFPRNEAEMLRHLAMHRKEDVSAARAVPRLAHLATVWQDDLIDEQIIKDRDTPDSQVWLAGEIRKSQEELDEELAASALHQQ